MGSDETLENGQRASEFVRREFTWDQSVAKMIARLQVLRTELPTADGSSPVEVGAESTTDHRSSTERFDLSVCVLTKNHEDTIADCLAAVAGRAQEIIVHDLGSTDRTLSIAREFGARITMGVDVEHRGASRNVAIGRATSEWILSLDGDERIEEEGLDHLAEALAKVAPDVLGLRGEILGSEPIADQKGWHGEVRVFRNRNDIACECRGLERVTAAIRRIPGARILDVPFVIRRGVVSADTERLLRARLHRDQLERGRDPESLWGLGVAHARSGDFFHAESYLHDCWIGTPPDHPLHGESLKLLVECYRRIGDEYRASEFAERLKSMPGGVA